MMKKNWYMVRWYCENCRWCHQIRETEEEITCCPSCDLPVRWFSVLLKVEEKDAESAREVYEKSPKTYHLYSVHCVNCGKEVVADEVELVTAPLRRECGDSCCYEELRDQIAPLCLRCFEPLILWSSLVKVTACNEREALEHYEVYSVAAKLEGILSNLDNITQTIIHVVEEVEEILEHNEEEILKDERRRTTSYRRARDLLLARQDKEKMDTFDD